MLQNLPIIFLAIPFIHLSFSKDVCIRLQEKHNFAPILFLELIQLFRNIPQFFQLPIIPNGILDAYLLATYLYTVLPSYHNTQ